MMTKNYCPKCEHCKKILNFKGEFDYELWNISDSTVNNPSVIHLDKILRRIKKQINKFPDYNGNITINLSYNYIRDAGMKELSEFIHDNIFIFNRLTVLNLRSNRLTSKSFEYIMGLFSCCPQIYIDLSANHIRTAEFEKEFGHITNRVECSVY